MVKCDEIIVCHAGKIIDDKLVLLLLGIRLSDMGFDIKIIFMTALSVIKSEGVQEGKADNNNEKVA